MYDILKEYPQIVAFSGHSHVSFVDPRNIWQGDYTALNCGSVLYTALDYTHHLTEGITHNSLGIAPRNRGESSTALIVEVKGTKVTVRRIDMYWDVEIPITFVFDTSVNKANFPYREEKRIAESSAPVFAPGTQIIFENVKGNGFEYTFRQAVNTGASILDDGAFAYDVSIKNATTGEVEDTARLQANYFMIPRPESITHDTDKLTAETEYEISITPIGYFGKAVAPVTARVTTVEGGGIQAHPIPVAALLSLAGIPELPPGMTMDAFITAITGYPLSAVNGLFGKTLFYKDEDMQEPFTGSDAVTAATIIYSIISLEELLSYL